MAQKNTFGLGPIDQVVAEWQGTGLGQPLQNTNRGISAQGQAPEQPDMPDVGATTGTQPQFDTRNPIPQQQWGRLTPPPAYVPLFEAKARKYNVPVNVLMALGHQESRFNPDARGTQTQWGTAKGMMQYLDGTARNLGINPYDPDQAVDAAARQIRERLDKGYSMEDAVKEHFAGPNRKLWGKKTAAYGVEVLEKARRIADEMYADLGQEPVPEPTGPVSVAETDQKEINEVLEAAAPETASWLQRNILTPLGDFGTMGVGGAYKGIGSTIRGIGMVPKIVGDYTTTPLINAILGTDYQTRNMLDAPADAVSEYGERISAGVSPETKEAIKNSTPDGDIFKPSTWTLGSAPSLRGYAALGAEVLGQMLPVIASTVATSGAGPMARVMSAAGAGGAQGGGAAVEQARDTIDMMAKTRVGGEDGPLMIEKESAYYRDLRSQGKSHEEAVAITRDAAERIAFLMTAPISGAGGVATSKIINPAEKILSRSNIAGRVSGRAALGAAEEGTQEVAEAVQTNRGVNIGAGTNVDITEGTFADFVLGAIGGGTAGAGGGALSRREGGASTSTAPDGTMRVEMAHQDAPRGPLARAVQAGEDESQARRVVAETPGGTVTGFLDSFSPDGQVIRILGDDGQVYQFTPQDNVRIRQEGAQQQPAALPPPTITVDAGGTAMTTDQRQAVAEDRAAQAQESAARREQLGMTPDIDRVVQAHKERTTLPDAVQAGQAVQVITRDGEIVFGRAADYARTEEGATVSITDTDGNTRSFSEAEVSEVIPQGEMDGRVPDGRDAGDQDAGAVRGAEPQAGQAAEADGQGDGAVRREPESAVREGVADAASDADAKRTLTKNQYEAMTLEQLQERRKYLSDQAVGNRGWDKTLLAEKRKLEAAMRKIAPEALETKPKKAAPTPAEVAPPVSTPPAADLAPTETDVTTPQGKALVAFEMPDGERILVRRDQFEEGAEKLAAFDERGNRRTGPRQQVSRKNLRTIPAESGVQTAPNQPETRADTRSEVVPEPITAGGVTITPPPAEHVEAARRADQAVDITPPAVDTTAAPVDIARPRVTPLNDDFGNWSVPDGTALVSTTGRALAPSPKFDASTPRKRTLSLTRQRQWLVDEAIKEAEARGDGFMAGIFRRTDPGNFSRSDYDSISDYLFGSMDGPTEASFAPAAAAPAKPAPTRKPRQKAPPKVTENAIFTEDAAEKARALLRSKLSQLNTGIDPEIMQAGITLAGYHIERGARTFAAYSQAMVADLGDIVRPYLKSWYAAVSLDPRAAGFDGMTPVSEVASLDLDAVIGEIEGANTTEGQNDAQATTADADASVEGPGAESAPADAGQRDAGDVPGQPDRANLGEPERGQDGDREPGGEPAAPVQQRDDSGADAELRIQGRRGSGAPAGDRADRQPASAARNHRIGRGDLAREGSWKSTAERNVDIVELVKRLDAEGRTPTPEEKALMTRFTGWGASEIANGIFPDRYGNYKPGWKELGERLKAALTPEEYEQARRTTQYAHYTSEGVIRSIYDGLDRLGFKGGLVLEPGAGVGLFNGLMPAPMAASSTYTGIEYDGLTGAIARHLYPESNIIVGDFTKTNLPKDFYDAAIGNPPFSSTKITNDPEYKRHGFMLHDYFFAKTIDRVKPGGLVVFVTSKGTMDKTNDRARKYLAERANLLGAVRLPQTAFKGNAGTEVVTDVLFLQKRGAGIEDNGVKWLGTKDVKTAKGEATPVNEYFADHPEMVLGEHALEGSMYRANEYTVLPREGDIEQQFAEALRNLPEAVYRPERGSQAERAAVIDRDYNPKSKKEGGLYLGDDGALMQVENGSGVPVAERIGSSGKPIALKPAEKRWLKGYVGVRDALKQAQFDQLSDGDWEASLAALNQAYDAFVAEHGPVLAYSTIERTAPDGSITETKRFKNKPLFEMDAEGALAYALERIREDGSIEKGVALRERVLKRQPEPKISTAQDAMFVTLDRLGRLDLDEVARLAGMSRDEAIDALGTSIYEDPAAGWQQADQYLSGNVVQKLAEARAAAEVNPRYRRNVEALLAVQPRPLGPTDITVRIGANWVPTTDYQAFASEILGENFTIRLNDRTGDWTVEQRGGSNPASEWRTGKMSPADIMEAILNARQIRITYRDAEGKTHLDPVETEKAGDVAQKMRQAFSRWIWTDPDRADRLTNYYNEHFNNIAPRQYDGSHLTLPGVSLRFNLYPHQKRAIWRNIQDGDTYLAHAVGSGKTFTMIASGMEQKRLGLIERPWYVVPNHMLAQFSREFLELYPTAHIMVADEQNFHTSNRRRFIAQAALNNPDAVIITHSAFERISMSDEFSADFIGRQIDEWKEALEDVDKSDRITRKQMERRIEQLERRLEAKQGKEKKDAVMTFEETGADYLFVDEAHEFRKLDFATNQGNIKGVDPSGSQRALDLYMKVQYLRSKKPGRAVTLASGTPITNTMGEMFTVQRLMAPEQLEIDGLDTFDAWSAQYGDTVTALEQNAAGGYESVTRFAKFQNVPELMRRVRSFMDVVTNQNLGTLVKRPDVEGGGRKIVVTPPAEGYREYQKELEARIKAIRNRKGSPKPGDDIILSVIADGRFSAIDMRFVDPTLPPDPNSKLNVMLDDVIAAYRETSDNIYRDANGRPDPVKGSSLIIFSDIGLGEQSAAKRGFSMKDWITKRLTDAGIPASEIAFIRDHKQHAKKERLFADMREGKKRILIGGKDMETGVNVQKRLTDLFHLDAPWFPASVEQREGRIVRQGNQNQEVRIRAYAAKGSYDSTMWGMNARKARFIEQAMNGDDSVRSMEDVSEASSFEMASALASGDERYLKLAGLRGDVERLQRLKQAHYDQQNKLRRERQWAESLVEQKSKLVGELEEAIGRRVPIVAGEFSAKAGNTTFDARDEFSAALFGEFKDLAARQFDGEQVIGEIGGFTITYHGLAQQIGYTASVHVDVPGNPDPLIMFPIDPDLPIAGIATRAANQVNGLDRRLADARRDIEQAERNIEQYRKRAGAAFPEEAELIDKQGQLIELEAELASEQATAEAEQAAQADAPAEQSQDDAAPAEKTPDDVTYSVAADGGRLRASMRGTAELRGQTPLEMRSAAELRNMDKAALRARVFDELSEARSTVLAHPDVGAITINRKGLGKSRANAADRAKLLTVPHLAEMIRDGVYLGSQPQTDKGPGVVGYHYLARRVVVDGVPLTALITLEEQTSGKVDYYNHTMLTDIDGAVPARPSAVDADLASYRRPSFHADPTRTRGEAALERHADIRRALTNGPLGGVFERLMGDGRINLHPTEATLPTSLRRDGAAIQGFTDRAGRVHLVAENLTPQTAMAVLLHEAFHSGVSALSGQPRWTNLNRQLQRYYEAAQRRRAEGRTKPGDFWDEALRRVEAAQAAGAIDPARAAEEFGAYAIENYELAPSGIRKWIDTVLGVIKDWLASRFGLQVGAVTPAQLRAMAVAALRAADGTPSGTNDTIGGMALNEGPLSVSDVLTGIRSVVRAAMQPGNLQEKARFARPVSWLEGLAQRVGLDISGYSHVVDTSAVRHTMKNHGDAQIERARGQLPITPADFEAIPQIVSSPDRVVFGTKNRLGRDQIGYAKRMPDGSVLYLEEVRTGRRELAAVSMRKYPATMNVDTIVSTLDPNAQGDGRDANIVVVDPADVKEGGAFSVSQEPEAVLDEAIAELDATELAPDRGDFVGNAIRDMAGIKGMYTRFLAHPYQVASLYPEFTPVFQTQTSQQQMRNQIIEDLHSDHVQYQKLPQASKARVNAVLELGRLMGQVWSADALKAGVRNAGYTYTVRMDEEGVPHRVRQDLNAQLSKPGDVLTLNDAEAEAYQHLRDMFDRALDKFRDQALEEFGMGRFAGQPKAAQAIREAIADQPDTADKRRMENIAQFIADIEQAKRTGYVPFTRYGDYVVAVKERQADIEYTRDPESGTFIARGVPSNLEEYLDRIGAQYDTTEGGWRLSREQRRDLEEQNERTVYSEKVETGLRDMFGRNSEARVKRRQAAVSNIPSVKTAIERINREQIGDKPNRRIVAFATTKKRPEGGIDMSSLDALAEVAMLDPDTWEAVRGQLAKAVQAGGFRKHFFQSTHVPGYSADFERSIADYVVGLSGYLARRAHNARWDKAIAGIKGERLHRYATKYREYVNQPMEELALLRQTGFFMYLAGNLSTALLNATQVPLMTMPFIASFSSNAQATNEMTRAYKDALALMRVNKKTGFDLFDFEAAPADIREDLLRARDEGLLLPLQSLEVMGVANRRSVEGRQIQRTYDRTVQTVALTFTAVERLNRLVTFIAANRMARKPGYRSNIMRVFGRNPLARSTFGGDKFSPYAFAEFAVDETQFRMGKGNRPTAMRGIGTAIMQFKSFMLQFLEALYRNWNLHGREGKRATAGTLLMLVALSGLWGFPGAEDLRELFEGMYKGITKKDFDARTELRKWIVQTTDQQWLGSLVDGGFPYMGGADMSRRVGLGSLAPESRNPTGIDWLDSAIAFGGVPADLMIGRPIRAAQQLGRGDVGGAAGALAPNFIENARKAANWSTDGVRTQAGRMVLPAEQVKPSSVAMKAIGVQPSQISDVYAYQEAQRRSQSANDELKRQLTSDFVRAMGALNRNTDPSKTARLQAALQDVIAEIADHNEGAAPDQRIIITRQSIRSQLQREMMGTQAGFGRERKAARGSAAELREVFGVD